MVRVPILWVVVGFVAAIMCSSLWADSGLGLPGLRLRSSFQQEGIEETGPDLDEAPLPTLEFPKAETDKERTWGVTGKVTDDAGKPMAGVEVVAQCGMGTLFETGKALSGEDGTYTLHFGPGVHFERSDWIQVAIISARKEGFCDKTLGRQGNLRMTDKDRRQVAREITARHRLSPSGDGLDDVAMDYMRAISPDSARNVDFVMVPAAKIHGRLLDKAGKPIAKRRIYVTAKELPPGCNVFASADTNEAGEFTFKDIAKEEVWFEADKAKSDPEFLTPGSHEVELTLTQDDPPKLATKWK